MFIFAANLSYFDIVYIKIRFINREFLVGELYKITKIDLLLPPNVLV